MEAISRTKPEVPARRRLGFATVGVLLAAVIAIVPASDLAVNMLNWDVTHFLPPRLLSRMETLKGIPADAITMVRRDPAAQGVEISVTGDDVSVNADGELVVVPARPRAATSSPSSTSAARCPCPLSCPAKRCRACSTTWRHSNGLYYLTYSANNWESPFYGVGYAIADNPLGQAREQTPVCVVREVEWPADRPLPPEPRRRLTPP